MSRRVSHQRPRLGPSGRPLVLDFKAEYRRQGNVGVYRHAVNVPRGDGCRVPFRKRRNLIAVSDLVPVVVAARGSGNGLATCHCLDVLAAVAIVLH